MSDLLYIGQWQGFFSYGPEYGEIVHGQEVEFRLFIEEYNEGQFSGKVIDWEGIGANGEISEVKGFIDEDHISFTKIYPKYYILDEWGNESIEQDASGLSVTYEGKFDMQNKCFTGSWEITYSGEQVGEFLIEEITTGTWRMKHED
jgi:hypothetical protein